MDEATIPPAVFQLFDVAPAEFPIEALGPWAIAPSSTPGAVAFDAASGAMADAPVWRANLPADLHLAGAHLAAAKQSLHASQKVLDVTADRLQTFVEAQRAGVAYDISSEQRALAQPEAELLSLLSQIREGRPSVSFGLGKRLIGGWEEASRQFHVTLERLQRFVAYYAWVETHLQGELLGQTTVSWTGDVDTVWREKLASEQMLLHQDTLALALQSQEMLMRTFIMAVQFAIHLSGLLITPGGAILALPATWRFINQVLAEFGQQA